MCWRGEGGAILLAPKNLHDTKMEPAFTQHCYQGRGVNTKQVSSSLQLKVCECNAHPRCYNITENIRILILITMFPSHSKNLNQITYRKILDSQGGEDVDIRLVLRVFIMPCELFLSCSTTLLQERSYQRSIVALMRMENKK